MTGTHKLVPEVWTISSPA